MIESYHSPVIDRGTNKMNIWEMHGPETSHSRRQRRDDRGMDAVTHSGSR